MTSRTATAATDKDQLPGELTYATLSAALAVLAGMAAERLLGFSDLSLIFITAVIFVAVRTRMSVAVYSAILCFLAYNYFFIHPRYTFFISARQGVATVAMFLVAALICGRLANRLRAQVLLLRAASSQASALQRLGRRLTAAADESEAVHATIQALREALEAEVLVFTEDEHSGKLVDAAQGGEARRFDPILQTAMGRCWANLQAGGDGSVDEDLRDLSWHCLPLALRGRALGVACLRFPVPLPQLAPEQSQLLEAMLRDLAQALARARLVRQLEAARVQGETERLRAALLSSVSHDLRSPLSTIIGSAESLVAYRDRLSADDQVALAGEILNEGQRLDRYIQNLLDMTRVGQGALALTREWIGLDEIAGAVLVRLRKLYPAIQVSVALPEPAPLLHVNPALIEQALFNVLDNAAKFSPPGQPITLRASVTAGKVQLEVCDRGPGIPEVDRQRVFERFYAADRGDRSGAGTGLGLTICQGIIVAHGGEVAALPGENGLGCTIRMSLPLDTPPTDAPRED